MMGNWSLGTYFKEEQLEWCWNFFTKELSLPKEKLYISVFTGTKTIPKDSESVEIWKKLGVSENKIYFYGPEKNWWSRAGVPEKMPPGEPGGVTSEIFYQFTQVQHNPKYGPKCHPNCDCGRFLEIGNSVFMQYKKEKDGIIKELSKKNVDFGGGLERMLAAINNNPDIFITDIFKTIVNVIEQQSGKKYFGFKYQTSMRVIADHLKGAVFMAKNGVEPGNKDQGYIMRRLIRRAVVKMMELDVGPLKDNCNQFVQQLSVNIIISIFNQTNSE